MGSTAQGVLVPAFPDILGYAGAARIVALKNGATWQGEVQVKVELRENDANVILTGPLDEKRRVLSIVNWYVGRSHSFADAFGDTGEAVRLATGGLGNTAKAAALAVVAVSLILLISYLTFQRSFSTVSQMAFVATPGAELDARTAGKLEYAKTDGPVQKGEFYAALRTPQGFAKFLEANQEGTISANAVGAEDYVRKGQPILRLSSTSSKRFVAVFVEFDDAVKALQSATARVEFVKSGKVLNLSVNPGNYANAPRVFTDENGKALAQINLSIPEDTEVPLGEPLIVKFQRPLWRSGEMSALLLKTLSLVLPQGS
ncbi:hypothetical protein [Sinorhizobium sp. BJ1]|uniref:hypothetical protein n=1 Tax=Sinorhizobium sp. BJ1 TaxID=2035455 RepID=UPI000BE9A0EA|nr:hypothetical protein [Sinorhizobium sp. BJ1]PDT80347.1 hypothetical protein CO676_28105 [Sinorhizobium sp. BJ1]